LIIKIEKYDNIKTRGVNTLAEDACNLKVKSKGSIKKANIITEK